MNRKYDFGTWLIVVFVVTAGLLFCCDRQTESPKELESVLETEEFFSGTENSDAVTEGSESVLQDGDSMIYVYICGMVKEPGVYELKAGTRLFEAIEAAGGAVGQADLDSLNLADILEDGEKIYVPAEGETLELSENTEDKASDGRVNINTATVDELQALPGIGEAKARAIIAYREANGSFTSIEELRQVPGIKDGIYGQVQSLIRVD